MEKTDKTTRGKLGRPAHEYPSALFRFAGPDDDMRIIEQVTPRQRMVIFMIGYAQVMAEMDEERRVADVRSI